jgi:hypothetical protein
MGVLHFDGFDDYATKSNATTGIQVGGWIVAGNTHGTTPTGDANRNPDVATYSGRYLRYANPTVSFCQDEIDLGSGYSALGGGMTNLANEVYTDWYNSTLKGERILAWYDSARVYQCELVLDQQGRFHFCRGSTILASSPLDEYALFRGNLHQSLSWEIEFSQTVGEFRLWLNGVQIINATGLDNCDTANTDCRYVRSSISSGLDTDWWVDDWYITDGSRITGSPFVLSLHPTSDGGVNVWTASSGTDEYAMVDDLTSDTDSTYNQASTAGDESRHGCENLPAYVTDVVSVSAIAWLRKTDATARSARVLLNSNGAEVVGTTLTLTTSYGGSLVAPQDVDPDTTAAWTLAAVDALEVGYEVVS